MQQVHYLFIVRRGVAHVMDWLGNRVSRDMPVALARANVARHNAAVGL